MRTHRQGRLDRDIAEHLLDGAPGPGHADLDRLLARLTAPVQDTEIAGEEAALAAFEQAGRPAPRQAARIKSVLVAHAVAVACACILVGGAALATVAGSVPLPAGEEPSPRGNPTQKPGGSAVPTVLPSEGSNGGRPVTPDFAGLCRDYTTRVAADPGQALDHPSTRPLISAAGGRDKVEAFCATALDTPAPPPEALREPGRPPPYHRPGIGTPPDSESTRPDVGPRRSPHAPTSGPRHGNRFKNGHGSQHHPGQPGHAHHSHHGHHH